MNNAKQLLESVKMTDNYTSEIFYEIDLLGRDDLVSTLVEISAVNSDEFLKINETLTRIGFANRQKKELTQTCHILHKKGRYFIVHYKEMQAMDEAQTEMVSDDYTRRNYIGKLLESWNLVKIINNEVIYAIVEEAPINVYILPYKDKKNWKLLKNYTMGSIKEYTTNGNK